MGGRDHPPSGDRTAHPPIGGPASPLLLVLLLRLPLRRGVNFAVSPPGVEETRSGCAKAVGSRQREGGLRRPKPPNRHPNGGWCACGGSGRLDATQRPHPPAGERSTSDPAPEPEVHLSSELARELKALGTHPLGELARLKPGGARGHERNDAGDRGGRRRPRRLAGRHPRPRGGGRRPPRRALNGVAEDPPPNRPIVGEEGEAPSESLQQSTKEDPMSPAAGDSFGERSGTRALCVAALVPLLALLAGACGGWATPPQQRDRDPSGDGSPARREPHQGGRVRQEPVGSARGLGHDRVDEQHRRPARRHGRGQGSQRPEPRGRPRREDLAEAGAEAGHVHVLLVGAQPGDHGQGHPDREKEASKR